MSQDKTGTRDAMPDRSDLLESARSQALKTMDAMGLRDLLVRLEVACEAARVTAVRDIQNPNSDAHKNVSEDAPGFADLYGALRRARAEATRRETDTSRAMQAAPGQSTKPALTKKPSNGRGFMIQPTTRR